MMGHLTATTTGTSASSSSAASITFYLYFYLENLSITLQWKIFSFNLQKLSFFYPVEAFLDQKFLWLKVLGQRLSAPSLSSSLPLITPQVALPHCWIINLMDQVHWKGQSQEEQKDITEAPQGSAVLIVTAPGVPYCIWIARLAPALPSWLPDKDVSISVTTGT